MFNIEENKYDSFEALQNDIQAFIGESMDMPTLKQLSHGQRFDLINAIIKSGGSCKVADQMGLTFRPAADLRNQLKQ